MRLRLLPEPDELPPVPPGKVRCPGCGKIQTPGDPQDECECFDCARCGAVVREGNECPACGYGGGP